MADTDFTAIVSDFVMAKLRKVSGVGPLTADSESLFDVSRLNITRHVYDVTCNYTVTENIHDSLLMFINLHT